MSASDAAAEINRALIQHTVAGRADSVKTEDMSTVRGFFWLFWDMYWLIGCQIDPVSHSDAMDRQVSMFAALKQLPSERPTENGSRLWQDLPVMGMSITERWNGK